MLDRAAKERYLALLIERKKRNPWTALHGPQTMAWESEADVIGYGGAAGGGKTDLLSGLALIKHKRVLIVRREKAQTDGIVQRIEEILGHKNGYNSQKSAWKLDDGRLLEFGGLDNMGDEKRWQGRAHDLKALDEATEIRESQARFIMGWNRTSDPKIKPKCLLTFNPPTNAEGRWVLDYFAPWLQKGHPNPASPGELRWFAMIDGKEKEVDSSKSFVLSFGKIVYEFEEKEYKPEEIIKPKSRTFIPARVTDNKYYMETGYMNTLQSLPEPLRSQMLYGDFGAGIEDDPWQVIPTAWVEIAQKRWRRPDKLQSMDSMGIDVARGGRDSTAITRRHGMWFDETLLYPGSQTPDGPVVAGLAISVKRDEAVMHIDVIGVGSSPYDFLKEMGQQVIGVNVSESATGTDKSGRLRFKNLRSELWWRMREALDPANNTGIALSPDPRVLADLCAPRWTLSGSMIYVESRDAIVSRIGRSPDIGSAHILALIDTPKRSLFPSLSGRIARSEYNPYERKK